MSLDTNQQIYELINKSKSILITFRKNFNGDALGSALALALMLKKIDKKVELATEDFALPQNFSYLPEEKVLPSLNSLKKFIINLSLKDAQVNELSYEINENDKLEIFVTPKSGTFNAGDVSFQESDFKYDLIFTIDTPDLDLLDKIYQDNTEFFYRTPIINIDHSPSNENYGQINLVDLTATSSAEIIYNLLETMSSDLLDEKVATCLLTGIIAETRSFKTPNVTPKTLNIASQLIAAGAEREKIIQNLYRTRSLATLKLWGRVLARIENDPTLKVAWSLVSQQDFIRAGATEENLFDVIDELIANSPEAEIIVLIYEQKENQVCCLISSKKEGDINTLSKFFGPKVSSDLIKFCLKDKKIIQAKEEIISEIRRILEAKNQGKIV